MANRTEICITIDTEFSIAGHFSAPEKYLPVATPIVTCPVNGQEQGLGFLLDTFAEFDIAASFFVECANHCYFGDEPMASLVQRIQQAQQDLQLHIHPVWLSFNKDNKLGTFPQNDNCAGRSFEDLKRVFEYCIEVFERWTNTRPVAIRTGSLWADLNVYEVMQHLKIPMSSNIGLGIFEPKEPALQVASGRRKIKGVMEVPVFTYQDNSLGRNPHKKSLQITSCSWPEMECLLWKARKMGVTNIVILTHPFEFVKKADWQFNKLNRNRVNQTRLKKLCQFIRQNDQDFVSTSFAASHEKWCASELQQPHVKIPGFYSFGRKIHNKINDLIWHY